MKLMPVLFLAFIPVVAVAATFSKQFTVTGTPPPPIVTNITEPNTTVVGGAGSAGRVVGPIGVTMSDGSAYTRTLTLSDCTAANPPVCTTPSVNFALSSAALPSNLIIIPTKDLPVGTYSIQLSTN